MKFRSYTVNIASQNARMTIITLGLAIAVFAIIVSVIAVQLIAGGPKGLAGRMLHSISAHSLSRVISQEIPMYASVEPEVTMAPKNMLLYLFTDIDAGNPLTVVGSQIPGMAVSDFQLLTPGPEYDIPPIEHSHSEGEQPNADAKPRERLEDKKTSGEPLVYVYHSHNRESFLPELPGKTDPSQAYDGKINIEQAGTALIEGLKKEGYAGLQTLEDYWTKGDFDNAYDYSRPTIEKVLKEHKNLQLIFDIHRDANKKNVTTREINGQQYATVYIIVGGGNNPHAEKNEALAYELHNLIVQMYPGLSRGVWKKNSTAYDTRYNHDLSPNMVLLEIGGPENTMEEVKRTAEAMSKVSVAYLKKKGFAPQKFEDKQ
jgi:stage II sporulation protein P